MKPPTDRSVVFVVDDDASVREALDSLIRSVGLRVETFSSGRMDPPVSCWTFACRIEADFKSNRSLLQEAAPSPSSSSLGMETFR